MANENTVIEKCLCGNDLTIEWNNNEKFKMVRCQNCNNELKFKNPNLVQETLDSIIKRIADNDLFWETTLKNYFGTLTNKTENEKIKFLNNLATNKILFNEFTKEITKPHNPEELFNKYNII